jgi:hypothetical protein
MSIEKKSLISALKTTKKANVASTPEATDKAATPKAESIKSLRGVSTKSMKGQHLTSLKSVQNRSLKGINR